VLVAELPLEATRAEVPPPPVAALIRLSGTEPPPVQAEKLEARAKTRPDWLRRGIRAFYSFVPIEAIASITRARQAACSHWPDSAGASA